MTYEIGTVYHGLRLTGYCGGGAYGEVYVCTDISGRQLAVKIISKTKLGDDWEHEIIMDAFSKILTYILHM